MICNKAFVWFSGNPDQRCHECQFKALESKEETMTNEQELIQALKNTIAIQADLITHLKLEVARLNAPVITSPPFGIPSSPLNPVNPQPYVEPYPGIPHQPVYPGQPGYPYYPSGPWYQPPYIITSDTTAKIDMSKISIGDPPGSVDLGGVQGANNNSASTINQHLCGVKRMS
jgi:hypothetical protein